MKLIDKDALVAKIKKLMNRYDSEYDEDSTEVKAAKGNVCHEILCTIDSFKVKEVDLEKEYEEFVVDDPVYNKLVNSIVGKKIAEHFFELGIKVAQKGE